MTLPVRRRDEVSRWEPVREFEELASRMGRLMESAFGGSFPAAAWAPPVDIEEFDDAFVVEAELPGVKRDDVTVELEAGELAIFGERKERERVGLLRRQTRRTGRFEYRVTLPGDVDPDRVEASLKDGVLRVRVPKTQRAQARRIEVRTE